MSLLLDPVSVPVPVPLQRLSLKIDLPLRKRNENQLGIICACVRSPSRGQPQNALHTYRRKAIDSENKIKQHTHTHARTKHNEGNWAESLPLAVSINMPRGKSGGWVRECESWRAGERKNGRVTERITGMYCNRQTTSGSAASIAASSTTSPAPAPLPAAAGKTCRTVAQATSWAQSMAVDVAGASCAAGQRIAPVQSFSARWDLVADGRARFPRSQCSLSTRKHLWHLS